MQIVSNHTMRLMDQKAIGEYGIPSIVLMEHAAMKVATYCIQNIAKNAHVMIFCGPGNNGGDGFALARLLDNEGYTNLRIYCNVPVEKMSIDEAIQYQAAKRCGLIRDAVMDETLLTKWIAESDILIDALFGTGLSREIDGFYKQVITFMNTSDKHIISIDIPSGIHGDTGNVMGVAVKADVTITFECLKLGQMQSPGNVYCGEILPVSIAIPRQVSEMYGKGMTLLDEEVVKTLLPKRGKFTHKGSFGKGLLIGGSSQMHGAITLCAQAALRSGIGTLTLFVPESIREIISAKMEECMMISTPHQDGFFASCAVEILQEQLDVYDFITIGNGMGRGTIAEEMVCCILKSEKPCILDGDALYLAGKHMDLLRKRNAVTILTPHPKELSYLSGISVEGLKEDRFASISKFMEKYPSIVLVAKDTYTCICDNQQTYLNTHGNNGLAKGGSGDVLCGIISGLFAQSRDALGSCACGVYIHALTAECLQKEADANSFLPSDMILKLSDLYKQLRR